MPRESFTGNEDMMGILTTMSEGNPGAATVLSELLKANDPITGMALVFKLDEMNMRGPQVWIGYKDHCGQDLDKFQRCIIEGDQEMVDTVNAEVYHPDLVEKHGEIYGQKAVRGEIHGESNGRMRAEVVPG